LGTLREVVVFLELAYWLLLVLLLAAVELEPRARSLLPLASGAAAALGGAVLRRSAAMRVLFALRLAASLLVALPCAWCAVAVPVLAVALAALLLLPVALPLPADSSRLSAPASPSALPPPPPPPLGCTAELCIMQTASRRAAAENTASASRLALLVPRSACSSAARAPRRSGASLWCALTSCTRANPHYYVPAAVPAVGHFVIMHRATAWQHGLACAVISGPGRLTHHYFCTGAAP
jgi:hypothetical protein